MDHKEPCDGTREVIVEQGRAWRSLGHRLAVRHQFLNVAGLCTTSRRKRKRYVTSAVRELKKRKEAHLEEEGRHEGDAVSARLFGMSSQLLCLLQASGAGGREVRRK
jgi:hypothetical protein